MINTFLFDLDGTLLPLDMDKFMEIYFSQLSNRLKEHIPPEKTIEYIWQSTNHMINNIDSNFTNMEVFSNHFSKITKKRFDELLPIFDEFYNTDFLKVEVATSPIPAVKEIVDILKSKNYNLVLATNPLFPRMAILHRIEWAGLKEEDFNLITSYEIMHACKPQIQYYEEILDIIGRNPEECIMVGNDVQEDMIAKSLGITTFLLEDQMIHREKTPPNNFDYRGSYSDLKNLIIEMF
ncbi:MAG TPA: HAD family hydrolase [Eubacteriaceae bacterium]|jgi:FMN phosphatase YigB (HAD superfamily)|nr:HAD family hydrolase [Eubacteriaceae bacterium]